MMVLAIMGISTTQLKSMHTKFTERKTLKGNTKEKNRALLNNSGGNAGIPTRNQLPENGSEFGETGERKQNSEERQARLAKVGRISLKGDSERRRTVCGKPKTNRIVPNAEIRSALRLNVLVW